MFLGIDIDISIVFPSTKPLLTTVFFKYPLSIFNLYAVCELDQLFTYCHCPKGRPETGLNDEVCLYKRNKLYLISTLTLSPASKKTLFPFT